MKLKMFEFDERLQIWKLAFQSLGNSLSMGHFVPLLLGHGYGSWYQSFGAIAKENNRLDLLLDTAHNFLVQNIFELGIVHTAALVGFLVYLYLAVQKTLEKKSKNSSSYY